MLKSEGIVEEGFVAVSKIFKKFIFTCVGAYGSQKRESDGSLGAGVIGGCQHLDMSYWN